MNLLLNGETTRVDLDPPTLSELLKSLHLQADQVMVELNGEIITHKTNAPALTDGDTLEIIRFIGGGSLIY